MPNVEAILYDRESLRIACAPPGLGVEELTRYACVKNVSGFVVDQFVQTALTAAVTQCFPLLVRQVIKRFVFPESGRGHRKGFLSSVVFDVTLGVCCDQSLADWAALKGLFIGSSKGLSFGSR